MLKKAWDWFWLDDSFLSWLANVVVAFISIKYVFYPLLALILGTSLPVVAVISGSMEHNPQNGVLCGTQETDFWDACGRFYEERNISQQQFSEFIFPDGFNRGDVMMIHRATPQHTEIGDVLVFQTNKPYPVIHRIVDISYENGERIYTTKGDHNEDIIREYALLDQRMMCNGRPCLFACYQETAQGVQPSLCGPGTGRVTHETPGAIPILDEQRITQDQVIGKAYGRVPLLGYVKIVFVEGLERIGLGSVAQLF